MLYELINEYMEKILPSASILSALPHLIHFSSGFLEADF